MNANARGEICRVQGDGIDGIEGLGREFLEMGSRAIHTSWTLDPTGFEATFANVVALLRGCAVEELKDEMDGLFGGLEN